MLLKVDCLPNAVGKQPSIPLINLGRTWTLNWWWWWWPSLLIPGSWMMLLASLQTDCLSKLQTLMTRPYRASTLQHDNISKLSGSLQRIPNVNKLDPHRRCPRDPLHVVHIFPSLPFVPRVMKLPPRLEKKKWSNKSWQTRVGYHTRE